MQELQTSTNYWLVAVSILTSIVASYAAFSIVERAAGSTPRLRIVWLTGGAVSLGLGIWTMHYLGMLSVQLPIYVVYHLPTVILSLLLAIFASAVVMVVVSQDHFGPRQSMYGSVLMGAGIGGMHYVGMHAMRCSAMHSYNLALVGLSVVVAVGFSWMSLWIGFSVRTNLVVRERFRLTAAVVMGLGIAAMHYTAMAAATFQHDQMPYSTRHTVHISSISVAALMVTMGLVLFGTLVTTLVDRKVYAELKLAHEQLAEERDRFHATAECSLDSLYICSAVRDETGEIADFIFSYLNSNVERSVGIPLSRLLGGSMCELLPNAVSLGHVELYKRVVRTGEPLVMEFATEDRVAAWTRIQAVKVRDGIAITASDITQRKQDEDRILHLAHHDPLTGLLNRGMLAECVDHSLELARRNQTKVGVFLIDLDGFKRVNDTLGHHAGDCLLLAVAGRLKSVMRGSDSVLRIGGDEFVVVASGLKQGADAELFAEKIIWAVQPPVQCGLEQVSVTCSVGCALYPDAAFDREGLLYKADLAMYTAKHSGKNQFRLSHLPALIAEHALTQPGPAHER